MREAYFLLLNNRVGSEQFFPMPGNGKGKGSCCGVVFMTFLKFSLKCREGNPCREAASNALKAFRMAQPSFKPPLGVVRL
jgi:hypothetical protein